MTMEKKDKLNFIKIKKLYSAKDTANIVKNEATDWEKNYFQNSQLINNLYLKYRKMLKTEQ